MVKKIILGIVGLVVIIILGFVVFVFSSFEKDYSEAYPVPELKVELKPEMIERGRYLANGPAHCLDCHSSKDPLSAGQNTSMQTLTGGFGLEIPPGMFYAPNITPDQETGIGRYSDGQLYRMLRHNIRHDGQAAIDFMPFINMSDEDIHAVIAYLRSLEPVKNKMPDRELTFLGKMLFATGAIKPGVPEQPILKRIKPDTSLAYGRYMAHAVANCYGCHTDRDMKSGEFIGEPFAGGFAFGPDKLTQGWVFVSPNLTPDEETGILEGWDEESFIDRMRIGKLYETTPMPWEAFREMSDDDLKAVYRYLLKLDPVSKVIEETVTEPN